MLWRSHDPHSYLRPADRRSHLRVRGKARVEMILFALVCLLLAPFVVAAGVVVFAMVFER